MIKTLFKTKLIEAAIDYAFDIAIINLKYPELKTKNPLSRYSVFGSTPRGVYFALRYLEDVRPQGVQGTVGNVGTSGVFGKPYERLRRDDRGPQGFQGPQGVQGTVGHVGTYGTPERLRRDD